MTSLRRHPRIHTDILVTVRNQRGESGHSMIRNLSPGGMMIDCDPAFKAVVCQQQVRDPLVQPVEVQAEFQLPGETVVFRTACRLIYVRRMSQFEFNLGLRFIEVSEHQAEQLQRYLLDDPYHHAPSHRFSSGR